MYLSKFHFLALGASVLLLCSGFTSTDFSVNNNQDPEVMSAGLFKIQGRLNAVIEHFDFDFTCGISSFRLVRVSKNNDPIIIENTGSDFSIAAQRIVSQAKAGDYYFFEDIKAKCVGDSVTRKLAGITVRIK